MTSAFDVRHLERAIDLAALGGNRVSPNPRVGSVIVRDGRVIGEGYHQGGRWTARRSRGDPQRR